jgi:uncharacterized protein (TIGR03435 family)
MNSDEKNLRQFVDRHLPSPSQEEMEQDCDRVLDQLQSRPAHQQKARVADPERLLRSWWQLTPMRIAAGFIAIAFLAVWSFRTFVSPDNVYAIVETEDGSLYRVDDGKARAVNVGDRIGVDTPLRTESGAGAVLKLPGGSLIEMGPKSELSLEHAEDGLRIRVNDGRVNVTPAKEPAGKLYVQNREQTVPVVSAMFQSAGVVSAPQVPETRVAFEEVSIRPAGSDTARGRGAAQGAMSILPSGCGGSFPIQVDPRRFAVYGTTLHVLVTWAYGSGKFDYQSCREMSAMNLISGGPGWVRSQSDLWDLEAVIPEGALDYTQEQLKKGEAPKLRKMLQTLLADRFKLVMRSESREIAAYELTAENGAPRLTVRPELREMLARQSPGIMLERGLILVKNAPIADFIPLLERDIKQPVLDRTGLTGQYSFLFEYTPLERLNNGGTPFAGPSIFSALPEQVGFKLEKSGTVTQQAWIIERVERPSEN